MENIATTLKHGLILNKAGERLFISAVVLSSFAVVVSLIATIYCYYLIIVALLFVIIDGIAVKFVAHQNKAKRDIKHWLVDAVELDAFCEEVEGSSDTLEQGSIGRVQVSFIYNGENIKLMSQHGANVKFGMATKYGTGTFFKEYVNKTIKILYSPKFNEVMFIKTQLDEETN